jgi:catechol 2,3-dioxygenase-like lactoylglutathione lyase family enzyme
LDALLHILDFAGIEVIDRPVSRDGACGEITSGYIRDPDGNLLELSNYP